MDPWTRTWALPEMHAGANPNGADDAWWPTALDFEEAALNASPVTGGSADIKKCFDQILRELLFLLLELGGMPKRVLHAYKKYMSMLTLYNCVAGTLGKGYKLVCGIPQGCPLSAVLFTIASDPMLLLPPQIAVELGVGKLVAFADDIPIAIREPKHLIKVANVFTLFYGVSGMSLASSKCVCLFLLPLGHLNEAKRYLDNGWRPMSLAG